MRVFVSIAQIVIALLVLPCVALAQTGSSQNEGRVALVIGNSAYQHTAKLINPRNDATDMAAALKKLGFEVFEGVDLDKAGMDRTIRSFAESLAGAKLGVFFYAGHGLQVDGHNYLVPIDARLASASGLDFEMVRLDLVQRSMERETGANVLFLDACRDNPLARNLARALGTRSAGIGRGLAAVESGEGTLVAFSTQPGNVAFDGEGRNSPFAAALVKHISTPGEDLSSILIGVRNDVMTATKRRQVPWDHSALTARVYFAALPAPRPSGPTYEEQAELSLWAMVKETTDPEMVRSYLERFPNGAFAGTARLLFDKLKRGTDENAIAAAKEAELRKAEEARKAAELAKIESERKAAMARQADELRKSQEEARRAREALAKAEGEREAARRAVEEARAAAIAAKAERDSADKNAAAAAREAELRRAEAASRAAELAKIESERKAAMAKQADELKSALDEAGRAREALAKAEKERETARRAAEDARAAANAAKAERDGADTNATAAARDAELRRAEEARIAAEFAKIERERTEAAARQAEELRLSQEEARLAREALAKAEAERETARKAAEEARAAAVAAKADKEKATRAAERESAPKKRSGSTSTGGRSSGSNCFTFNGRTFCQ